MKEGTCIHFNGPLANDTCGAGVNYRTIVGGHDLGWVRRTPCMRNHEVNTCTKFKEPTAEEIKDSEEAFERSFARMQKAIAIIRDQTKAQPEFDPAMDSKKQGSSGVIDCPVCGNSLNYVVSGGNHHIHGKCETAGCLAWMM